MRQAVCHLIQKLSIPELPWHGDPIIGVFQDAIDDNLSHTEPAIQEGAVRALSALCQQYYVKADGTAVDGIQDRIITHYVDQLKSSSEFSKVGFAQALGSLPKFLLSLRLKLVFSGLISASELSSEPGKFAESRRDAIKALASIACTVGLSRTGDEEQVVTERSLHELCDAFIAAMNDYTIDSRGDVGAWVREASMSGLETLTRFVVENDPSLLTPKIHPFPQTVLTLTKKEIFKLGDARKLITSVNVFCGLLQFPGVTRTKSFQQLCIFLCHKYPQVRKTTADQLYAATLTYDYIIPAESLDDVSVILSETSWDTSIEELRVIRNRLCDILGIPHPVLKSSTAKTSVEKKKDELESYKDLISRGY